MQKQARAVACSVTGSCQEATLEFEIGFFRVLSAAAFAATPYRTLFPRLVAVLCLGAIAGFLAGLV